MLLFFAMQLSDYYSVGFLATMDMSNRLSSWMIKLFGIDGRLSIRLYFLNITFVQ